MYEAYAAVERAYSQGRYDSALQQAQDLLATLDATPDSTADASADEALRPRLLLLIGHCHLYGLADPQQAAAAYRDVLERCNEPVLIEIAQESLGRCTTDAPAPASSPSQAASSAPQASSLAEPQPSAATPWLEQSTSKETPAQPAAARPEAELPLQALPQPLAAIKPQPKPLASPETQPLASQEPQAQAEPEPQVEPTPEPEPQPELIIPELVSEPEAPARPSSSFSPEEEEDLARGLLLVEL